MMRFRLLLLVLLVGSLSVARADTQADEPPSAAAFIDAVLAELGFDASHKEELHRGRILTRGVPSVETEPNELAVGAVLMLVRRPLEVVAEALVSDVLFRANSEILDHRTLGNGSTTPAQVEKLFDDIRYDESELSEAGRLLAARPGSDFNLSEAEFAFLRSLESRAGVERVEESERGEGVEGGVRERASAALSEILRARYDAYRENGLSAIDPYLRSGRKLSSPRRELAVALDSMSVVQAHFPSFFMSLFEYPTGPQEGIIHRFYWVKRKADERPSYLLSHRTEHVHGEFVVAGELQYYVGHAYNSMVSVIACVPTEAGTLVISVSRLFTDQVTGFGSALKKRVGRGQLVEAVSELFEKIRDELEKPSKASSRGGPVALQGQRDRPPIRLSGG